MSSMPSNDPMEFLKSLWNSMNLPLPGLMTPTLDSNELEKRIKDLQAVEGWLQSNLNMLQLTIQGLEMQRTALNAMQAMSSGAAQAGTPGANPFANPALWPWNFAQPAKADENATTPPETNKPDEKARKS